jgi:hypothetical protein
MKRYPRHFLMRDVDSEVTDIIVVADCSRRHAAHRTRIRQFASRLGTIDPLCPRPGQSYPGPHTLPSRFAGPKKLQLYCCCHWSLCRSSPYCIHPSPRREFPSKHPHRPSRICICISSSSMSIDFDDLLPHATGFLFVVK